MRPQHLKRSQTISWRHDVVAKAEAPVSAISRTPDVIEGAESESTDEPQLVVMRNHGGKSARSKRGRRRVLSPIHTVGAGPYIVVANASVVVRVVNSGNYIHAAVYRLN